MYCCQFLIILVSILHGAQFPLYKITVEEKCLVLSVIILILRVCNAAGKADSCISPLVDYMCRMTVDDRFQSHCTEFQDRRSYHSLKSEIIADVDCFFPGNVFSSVDKADAISFCISFCHAVDLFLGKAVQKFCHTSLICRNIFSISVEIFKI